MKKLLFNYILPSILWVFIHLWCMTLRKKILNPEIERDLREKPGKAIYTFWFEGVLNEQQKRLEQICH